MATEEEIKCVKCDSNKVNIHRHDDGSIDRVECLKCGHNEPYFQVTEKGKEVLKVLLQ